MTRTLREKFEEKYKDCNFHHRELVCFCDHVLKNSIIEFFEKEIALAKREGIEETITYISQKHWWEETEDEYRERFWFPKKYV